MRRRRQKNPLLMRIVIISVVIHVIALPILAQFGAFKRIQQHFVELTAVKLPPLPVEKTEVKKEEKAKPRQVAQKAKTSSAARAHAGPSHPSGPTPHIAVAAGGAGGGDNGGFTAPEGSGKVGEVPRDATGSKKATSAAPEPPRTSPTPAQQTSPQPTAPPQEIARVPEPRKEPSQPTAPTPAPHVPVFTEAEPAVPADQQPKPEIPDDLRQDAIDKTFVAEVTVGTDGLPTEIKTAQSTGNDELDRLALDTARRWKFKPGTRDGEPVESTVRLHIEFQVN